VQTTINYASAGWQPAKVFLVAEYTRATEITTKDGLITNVRALNI